MTKIELVVGGSMFLSWVILLLSPSQALVAYPAICTGLFFFYLYEKNRSRKAPVSKEVVQSEELKNAYEKINEIAHEIRAPLSGLRMACEQLSHDPGNQELVLAMTKLFPQQVEKIFSMTREISAYSKELSMRIK